MTSSPASIRENRLARETSPYLLQHKHNPVDWWPWGPDALNEAKRTGRPILLSIGYAACHWCHVMAHESFEDADVAAVMNALFVNIKVDREERPDIDQIYMSALHLLGEQGGWPLTMFLTSDGEPVWGGTYFPKTARYGRPGFTDVLRELSRLFREEPDRINQQRRALMTRLAERTRSEGRVVIGREDLDSFAQRLAQAIDPVNGGLRGAPKFPQAALFELLWRAGLRTQDAHYFELAELTLDRICQGGIYDHLGGGFSRYSVDARWLVPHFEKMLYDNAQLLELLALAFAHSGLALFRDRARETVAWLTREMTTPEGAFCASLDADSEGEEGKFYVWSLAEIEQVLGAENAAFFARYYDVTAEGNFEENNILNCLNILPRSMDSDAADAEKLAALQKKLLTTRDQRVRPGLDDKVLADWNGLMIAALANAGTLFDEPAWIAMAARAFAFITQAMGKDNRLGHSWRDGRLLYPGLASDFATMIKAGLALFEATGEGHFLDCAITWQRAFDRHYANADSGGYYLTADDAEGLVVRPNATTDDATGNPNGIAAQNLIRLAVLTGDDAWREAADQLFDRLLPIAAPNLFAHATLLNALDMRLNIAEIVVTGANKALLAAALKLPFIERIILRASSFDALSARHPAREMMRAAPDGGAFICVGERCSLPVSEPGAIAATLTQMRGTS